MLKSFRMGQCQTVKEATETDALHRNISECQGTHNSLPRTTGFLRYPTGRDQPLKTSQRWLKGKQIDDDVGPYWRVHDKLYDLTEFINIHPGGSDWIAATQGSDVTEVFESSHVSTAAESLLPKYFVKFATSPRNSPYTFHDDGFYRRFKNKVRPILKRVGTGPTWTMLMIMDSLTATFIAVAVCATVMQSLSLGALAGGCLTLAAMASHNFSHQRDNWRMYVYDLTLLSSYDWRVSHGLSHHPFPNTFYDVEIAKLEPLFELLPRPNKTMMQRYGCRFYEYLIFPIYMFVTALKKYYLVISGEEKIRPEYFLPAIELLLMIFMAPSVWGAIRIWIAIHTGSSCLLGFLGLILAHHHPDTYHEGDMPREHPDWGLCQMDATRDRVEITGNLFLVVTTLGDHTLHHLLPTVDHSKLHHLYPAFFEMCEEYGIPFRFYTQWEMFLGKYRALSNNKPSTQPPGYKPLRK